MVIEVYNFFFTDLYHILHLYILLKPIYNKMQYQENVKVKYIGVKPLKKFKPVHTVLLSNANWMYKS